jgi:predicted dithiol-disulfide oxidoreductase (DUF899 family)
MQRNKVVSQSEWLDARLKLLKKEKELTRLRDNLAAERRELPWVKVEKEYIFETSTGKQTLGDLFNGKSQLVIQHFMLGPGWREGCVGCSFGSDHINGALIHLENHDVSFVRISRAPLADIAKFNKRMGWDAKWVSSFESDFNFDFHVSFTPEELKQGKGYYNYKTSSVEMSELPGVSVFYKDDSGNIFHTYSTYARGDEGVATTYFLLDLTPKGRNETGPNFNLTDWAKHHDKYGEAAKMEKGTESASLLAEKCCDHD